MQPTGRTLSMDAPFTEGDDHCLLDRLPGDEIPAPDIGLLAESVTLDLERRMRHLRPREAEIVRLYYGLGRERGQNLEEIGQRFGATRERVRQIREEALCKLRQEVPSQERNHAQLATPPVHSAAILLSLQNANFPKSVFPVFLKT